ncbi:Uncharacterised protein [Mycobacterium tuberculosis]|uniref:Uncharacterized protein n=1 Tax=Mycobacterium tuberculosis TaxID=1773 RepID=A0A916PDT3_MYCTX|nr:Uncharacterised protein [Mycobacterium tuberculosis]
MAAISRPTTSLWAGSGSPDIRAGCAVTALRARDASWRAAASLVPSTSATSANGTANPSCSTNATR